MPRPAFYPITNEPLFDVRRLVNDLGGPTAVLRSGVAAGFEVYPNLINMWSYRNRLPNHAAALFAHLLHERGGNLADYIIMPVPAPVITTEETP